MARTALGIVPVVLGALLASGCLYDPEDRCGPGQTLNDDACACSEGSALVNGACVECGENETPGDGGCVCDSGYFRSAEGECINVPPGLGDECEDDGDCPADGASSCVTDDRGSYCTTSGCKKASDCPETYGCDLQASPAVCVRPPEGFGTPCEEAADCEGLDAGYCELVQAKQCLVNDCAADPSVCHGDWVCCDLNLIGQSLCMPPEQLQEGACPFGGTLVEKM